MQRIIKVMVVLAVLIIGATAAQAQPGYVSLFTAAYPNATSIANCALCHVNPAGGGTRNSFGLAFAAAGDSFTAAVANATSRCSGYTNAQLIALLITPGDGTTCPTMPMACTGYTYTVGACQSNNTAPVLTSVGMPAGCSGGAVPATTQPCTYVPPVTACTGYTYTVGACQSNNTAPVLTSVGVPAGCSGGAVPATTQSCTYVPPVTACTGYTYTVGACQSNNTAPVLTSVGVPAGCSGGAVPATTQSCTYVPPPPATCTYTYSAWGACQSGNTQTRTVTSITPTGCTGTPLTSQTCTYVQPTVSLKSDFSGSGQNDLVWRNKQTGENSIWVMNGTTFVSEVALTSQPDTNWKIVGIADMNGDGKPDIIWRNTVTGENSIWFMDGTTFVSEASFKPLTATYMEIVGVADMNGDGKPDIIWRNANTGHIAIWYMDGATVIGGTRLSQSQPDTNWNIVSVSDMDGDGKPDIIWRNAATGENSIWFMDGATKVSEASFTTLPVSYMEIDGVADMNGDGTQEIIWRNGNTGHIATWSMNGASVMGGMRLSQSQPDTNWEIVGPK